VPIVLADEVIDETSMVVEIVTDSGLRFMLPPDWPIEERAGVVGPVPVEEYLAMKFAGVNTKLSVQAEQLAAQADRITVQDEQLSALDRRIQELESILASIGSALGAVDEPESP